ncbi:hypothetical protein T265_11341 [Opisthorchis viverrini]|uniref:Uncharacterized protein n=1 Tax=Opisthorchis viverrini TaxID=6198 RepID=A0A074YZC5_OPIVI|nr:hypothetical protein T265_11341 [Opisthorchis viverrini]KER20023.1 hypothetical protein T265_11341 [Opisthorchis viverrini]
MQGDSERRSERSGVVALALKDEEHSESVVTCPWKEVSGSATTSSSWKRGTLKAGRCKGNL